MNRVEFYEELTKLLSSISPELDVGQVQPDTHLWANGYVDSLGLLEVISYLEDRLGHELVLEGDFLPQFFTMQRIYETFIEPAQEPVPDGRPADGVPSAGR